ncbi:MAG: LON peptidase substrate-binding domain-containing protein [Thermomicrobiales bacterium]
MTDLLPLFPLGTVMFPGMPLPLRVFEERYRRMLDDRHLSDPAFGIVLLRSGRDIDRPATHDLHQVGTAIRIVSRRRRPDGQSDLIVNGTRRFSIKAVNWDLGYGLATVEWHDDRPGDPDALAPSMHRALATFDRYVESVTAITGRAFEGVRMSDDPVVASWDLAARLPLHTWERQRLLERDTAAERFADLAYFVRREQRLLAVSGVLGVALNHPGHTFTLN